MPPTSRDISAIIQQSIDDIPGSSYQDKLDSLNLCNCCHRHNINKPMLFRPWIETETPVNSFNNHSCTCNCRHVARFICRQAPGYIPPIPPPNSPITVIH